MNLHYGISAIVSDAMNKYSYKGRPDWMFFAWIPLRSIRYSFVRYFRAKWIKPENKVQVRNTKVLVVNGQYIMDRLTHNFMMNHMPMKSINDLRGFS